MLYYQYGGICNNILHLNRFCYICQCKKISYNNIKIVLNDYNGHISKDEWLSLKIFKKFHSNILNIKHHLKWSPMLHNCIYLYDYLDVKKKQEYLYKKFEHLNFNNTLMYHCRLGDFCNKGSYGEKTYHRKDQIIDNVKKHQNSQILILTDPESVEYVKDITKEFKNIIYAYDLNLPLDEELLLASLFKNRILTKRSTFSGTIDRFNNYYYNYSKLNLKEINRSLYD